MIDSFSDYMRDTESVTDYTIGGKCSGCGECCSNILPLSASEIKEIKRYMKVYNIKEQKRVFPVANSILIDMTCPFLDVNKPNDKCTIYEVRPQICKSFMCNKKEFDMELLNEYRTAVNVRQEFFCR